MMDVEARKARDRVVRAERELEAAKAAVRHLEATCVHDWTEPEYTPEIREAYTMPGDAPGTMGIDWRGPVHIPREEKPKWTRRCRKCGKVETTTKITEHVERRPNF